MWRTVPHLDHISEIGIVFKCRIRWRRVSHTEVGPVAREAWVARKWVRIRTPWRRSLAIFEIGYLWLCGGDDRG